MSGQSQAGGNATDLFDVYFRRADLDGDGRISGSEAVSFFQGSNLSKNVLAQVWMHADQNRTGFLGRSEFYNALKLVTVAQSKRELTPDIVKAALYGPAAAKIPAPQINLAATPTLQSTPRAVAPTMQLSSAMPVASQSIIIGGPQVLANSSMNQQHVSYQQNQSIRPPQGMPSVSPKLGAANQGYPGGGSVAGLGPHNPSLSTDWFGGKTDNPPAGASSQIPNRGVNPPTTQDGFGIVPSGLTPSVQHKSLATSGLTTPVAPKPQDPSYHVETKNSKTSMASGNGFVPDSVFGDVNSLSQSHPKQDSPSGNFPLLSAMVPVSSVQQPLVRPNKPESTQSSITPYMHMGGQLQKAQSAGKQNQIAPGPTATKSTSAGNSLGGGNSSSQSQLPWPKTNTSDIQKYTKVFMEVDIDRDGKISGEQARNLFLSWRLPREVLKQVWDLSDQDNDSMLSLREFCIALYLMERYREGRPLPAVLPSSVMYDETLLRTTGQPTASRGNEVWGASPEGVTATRSTTPPASVGPPSQILPPAESAMQPSQQKSRVPLLEKHLVDQLSSEEQNSLNSKFQEATNADKKVEELEKEILDSRQNIEFYSTKMQEIILYKSKCDNRLNEIIERTSGNKHEVDSLVRKYEERYKHVGDVASKLTIDEAMFRDIQERKMDLYQAIIKMEQSEGVDGGTLRVNTDRIQSDLEELVKSLNERCKKYGLRAKPTTLVELPFGWQPGLQEGAADWDAEWDKLEDEGFTFVKELTLDVQNIIAPPKEKSSTVLKKANSAVEAFTSSSSLNADDKSEAIAVIVEQKPENGSANAGGRDNLERSPPDSPAVGSILGSPSQEWQESHTPKSVGADGSPHVRGTQSDHGGSTVSGDKKFDEPSWGAFDTDYDTGSVWGFDPAGTKEADHGRFSENSFLDSGLVGLSPIKTSSLQVDDVFQSKRALAFADSVPTTPAPNSIFADSVPSTPMHIFGNSPAHRGETLEDHSFNHFSRFDSFSINDGGFPARDSLSRFDSMRSTRDSEYGHGFTSFDDADPFGSSGLFKTSESQMHADTVGSAGFSNASFDSQTPKSTDADPFGSTATFKTSLDDQTQRRNYDNWNAF